jgi:hypothetical protein
MSSIIGGALFLYFLMTLLKRDSEPVPWTAAAEEKDEGPLSWFDWDNDRGL